jgi:RNA polymerase sigma factor (sigma-70 family)
LHENEKAFCKTKKFKKKYVNSIIILDLRILLIELIQNNDNHDEQMLIDERVKNEIHKVLLVLDDRERNIVECYFGINIDSEPMTLESIGEKYSLTKERIRQIKRKALMKLRANSYDLFNLIKE